MEYCAYALGDIIRNARNKMDLTQAQVAEMVGLDTRTIMNIENGKGNPKIKSLFPLFRLLKIDSHEVFYPEQLQDSASKREIRMLINGCTEAEAEALIPVVEAVLLALRTARTSQI